MKEITFNGHEYTAKYGGIFCDGKWVAEIPTEIKMITEIRAIEVDGRIFYKGKWFLSEQSTS